MTKRISLEGVPGSRKTDVLRALKRMLGERRCTTIEHTLLNGNSNSSDGLVRHVSMLLPFLEEYPDDDDEDVAVVVAERSPQSLHRVYLRPDEMDAVRYNLYKRVLQEATRRWKPQLVFYLPDGPTSTEHVDYAFFHDRYAYLLRHQLLKECEIVHVPPELSNDAEAIAEFVANHADVRGL